MAPRLPTRCCWAPLGPPVSTAGRPTVLLSQRPTPLPISQGARRGIKYGWSTLPRRSPRPEKSNELTPNLPPPTTGPGAAQLRREHTTPVRTGVLAIKKGMTSFYSKKGTRIPCTVLQLDAVEVVALRTFERQRYWALQVGLGTRAPGNVGAPQLGYYEARGLAPKQHLAEFRVRNLDGLLPVGARLLPDWFHVGQWVDVRAPSRGQGFAGGMKRHGFKGQGKSHGNSLNHRTPGTSGPSQGGGSRVHPGKKMPGRMGGQRVTLQNLSVLQVDNELGTILVKGSVGGRKGAIVKIQDAVKKAPPTPEFVEESTKAVLARTPNAAIDLLAARKRHLELKAMRRDGSIAQLVAADAAARGGGKAAKSAAA